jgi:hypothetical protein
MQDILKPSVIAANAAIRQRQRLKIGVFFNPSKKHQKKGLNNRPTLFDIFASICRGTT